MFVEVVRKNAETMDMNEAMVSAIEECLNKGILKEFLQEYGKELEEMCWERYDTERILQIQHEEALEDAREEGIQQRRAEAERTIFLLKQEKDREITLLRQEIEKLKRKACTFGQSVLE